MRELLAKDSFQFGGESGYIKPVPLTTLSDIPTIKKRVCMEYVLMRSSLEMGQFSEGLDSLRLLQLMKSQPSLLKSLFVYQPQTITAGKIQDLLIPDYKPRGSNQREEEEAVVMNWNEYLQDLEGI